MCPPPTVAKRDLKDSHCVSHVLHSSAWKATYLPTSYAGEGRYTARNSLGNIFVAGARWTLKGLIGIMTIRYSPTGGQNWVRVWSVGGPSDDVATGMVLGTAGDAPATCAWLR